jgi:hypothetical protein
MPAEVKSAPAARGETLQGANFVFQTNEERRDAIDKAFDYRGDVTLILPSGPIEGYLGNRDADAAPPRVELYVKGSETPQIIPYADISAIAFTGKDTADGKSWAAWVSKKESERLAEAERIRAEVEAQGHL